MRIVRQHLHMRAQAWGAHEARDQGATTMTEPSESDFMAHFLDTLPAAGTLTRWQCQGEFLQHILALLNQDERVRLGVLHVRADSERNAGAGVSLGHQHQGNHFCAL